MDCTKIVEYGQHQQSLSLFFFVFWFQNMNCVINLCDMYIFPTPTNYGLLTTASLGAVAPTTPLIVAYTPFIHKCLRSSDFCSLGGIF